MFPKAFLWQCVTKLVHVHSMKVGKQTEQTVKGGETMADGFGPAIAGNIFELLSDLIGETVTIFTTSGGDSGSGFTGVVLAVNPCFVRLVTHIGPAPGCVLGNACDGVGGYGGGNLRTVGSVTEIPLDRIAAVVSNAA